MIVISSSMGKSGSTFLCNLQEDMLRCACIRSGQSILRQTFSGRFIKTFSLGTIQKLLFINARYGNVVIKTHSPPTNYLRLLINLNFARTTYSYRDVRDVILSALDHGERNRQAGNTSGVYADIHRIEDAIDKVGMGSIREMYKWKTFGKVHFVRYENLMHSRLVELEKINDFLGWNIPRKKLMSIIEKHEKIKTQSLNFNKGTTERYKTEMTESEKLMCNHYFHNFLVEMNYEL